MSKLYKFLSGLAFLMVVLCISVLPAFAEGEKEGVILAEDVNIREQPNTSSKVVTRFSPKTVVEVYNYSDGWYQIGYQGVKGWINGWYLHVEGEALEVGQVHVNTLNLRKEPNQSADVLTQLKKDDRVVVYGKSGEWYLVGFDQKTGWVFAEYLTLVNPPKSGAISGNNVNIRKGTGTEYGVLTQLNQGGKLMIYSLSGDWYQVKIPDGRIGWVHKDYVKVSEPSTASRSAANDERTGSGNSGSSGAADATAQKLISFAKQYLGVKYKWGGESPSTGFDCSGFVRYVFKNFGIDLVHNSALMANSGVKINKSELKPGDVVFFNTNSRQGIDHVGIYLGNNQFIHASSSKGKVIITDMSPSSYYSKYYVTARRYLK